MVTKKIDLEAQALQEKILKVEAEHADLCKEHAAMGKKLLRLFKSKQKLQDKLDALLCRHRSLDWILECSHDESTAKYEQRKAYFQEKFKGFIHSLGFMPETQQVCLRIQMFEHAPKDEDLKIVLRGLKLLLPKVKKIPISICHPNTSFEGKYIGISEHTLGEYGILFAAVEDSGRVQVLKTTYGRTTVVCSFDDLKSFLVYVKGYLYYEENYLG